MYEVIKIHDINNKKGKYFCEIEMFTWLDKKNNIQDNLNVHKSYNMCNGCAYSSVKELKKGKFIYTGEKSFTSIADDYQQIADDLAPYVSELTFNRTDNKVILNFTMDKNNFLVINQYPSYFGVDFFVKHIYD